MTYNEWKNLPETKLITVPAREVSNHQIEITLPTGKAVVTAIRRHANQSPVVSATVRGRRAHYYGENHPYDAGDFAGGFQISSLTYENGDHSTFLGNCYDADQVK